MNLLEALAACNSEDYTPPKRLKLYARRTSQGTVIYGHTAGFTLPDGINDAEITIVSSAIQFHVDRSAEFRGYSYLSVLQEGPDIIRNHTAT